MAEGDTTPGLPASVEATQALLARGDYVAGEGLATVLYLALAMERPVLLEGESGVGKTEVAKVLATGLGRPLIRLQCYEGLEMADAAFEWNYPRQLMAIRRAEAAGEGAPSEPELYGPEYLLERPLLSALRFEGAPPVLLIDEIDRADEPFEAFLLEFLSEFQLSIPELGTVRAPSPPVVVITSNRTRDVHDALRRRCLYHWVDYPGAHAERRILALKAPGLAEALTAQLVDFVQRLRGEDLHKRPGLSETLDWAQALTQLDVVSLTGPVLDDTLGTLLKHKDDIERIRGSEAARLLAEVQAAA
ncbi:MAG: MoxR family ATPase [Xanthomonadales bacterium]|nr:MoxR family ATPase [Xanthomonadales bacterium]